MALKKQNCLKTTYIFFSLWIVSIIFFFYLQSILSDKSLQETKTLIGNIIGIDVIMGIISFLIFFISGLFTMSFTNKVKKTEDQHIEEKVRPTSKSSFFSLSTITIIILLLIIALSLRMNQIQTLSDKEVKPTITSEPTQILPTITEEPTQIPQVNAVYPTIDPDPIVDCKFTYIGTIKLRSSVCSKSTDCQIGGKWVYYDSVDKCKQDQQAEVNRAVEQWRANNPILTLPTLTFVDCTVTYPCTHTSSTYKLDADSCSFYQKQALNVCNNTDSGVQKAIDEMKRIANEPLPAPKIDGTIHMDSTPTPPKVPFGFGNY